MLGVGGSADDRRAAASAGCDQAPATKHASARESGQDLGVSQPLRLLVDTRLHSEDLARFETNVVRGPHRDDCAIWVGAIGGMATAGTERSKTLLSGARSRVRQRRSRLCRPHRVRHGRGLSAVRVRCCPERAQVLVPLARTCLCAATFLGRWHTWGSDRFGGSRRVRCCSLVAGPGRKGCCSAPRT